MRGLPDTTLAIVVPRHLGWDERPSWERAPGGATRWSFARLAATPSAAALDGVLAAAFPGVGTFASLAFPFGAFANNTEPPPSPFARSAVTPAYAPTAEDVFYAASSLPFGAFADRHAARRSFLSSAQDPSAARPMEDTAWGNVVDILVDDHDAPAGWERVLGRYSVLVWSGDATSLSLAADALEAFAHRGGVVVLPVGAVTPGATAALAGAELTPALRAVRAYSWHDSAAAAPPLIAEPALAVVATALEGAYAVATSVPEGLPVLIRRPLGAGAIYTCTLPWFLGRHGELSGLVRSLVDQLALERAPVALHSGPPTLAFASSSVRGERRSVGVANNAGAVWRGAIRVAAPEGCDRPHCRELRRGVEWGECASAQRLEAPVAAAVGQGRTSLLVVNATIAPFDTALLQVTCELDAEPA